MESLPITGLEELQNHLQRILEDAETPLEVKLFDEVELQLNGKPISSLASLSRLPE